MIPVSTMIVAALAAFLNIFLAARIGRVRVKTRVMLGDAGEQHLIARMRAHANYVEYTPFVLILMGLVEFGGGSHIILLAIGLVYLLTRILHALGMESGELNKMRMMGTIATMLTQFGLGVWAIILAVMNFS